MAAYNIITVNADNVEQHGFFCVKNKRHPGYLAKLAWLRRQMLGGLRLKLILTSEGRHAGFLEYAPGPATWRVVEADNYLVIHCIWVASNKFPIKGMAAALLDECMQDARAAGLAGLAVVCSDGSWMAGKEVFRKHGFSQSDEAPPNYQLLSKRIAAESPPAFPGNWGERLERLRGLQLLYTPQCPYIGKSLAELPTIARQYGIQLTMVELNDPAQARATMPSPYGVSNLVYNGRLLADRPFSLTRFKNILRKELGLQAQH